MRDYQGAPHVSLKKILRRSRAFDANHTECVQLRGPFGQTCSAQTRRSPNASSGLVAAPQRCGRFAIGGSALRILASMVHLLLAAFSDPLHAESTATNYFRFRMPHQARYWIKDELRYEQITGTEVEWVKAWPVNGSTNFVQFGNRIVVQAKPSANLKTLIGDDSLRLSRTVGPDVFIFQARDAATATREADRLARLPEVISSYPVIRQPVDLNGPYAYQPSDITFWIQFQLEHRNPDASRAGVDLNVRAAWPYSTGQGVTVAVADTGIEFGHPELAKSVVGQPHYSF